ncbi:Vacuolar protein 8 [Acipenser ruthenus]|uniref:Vacuolar protein 8 n=1 Tax=Acipenser ruthenus TaxID=7906 RepID=A0A662YSC4_ACIRT|nr:Vacuolar protein 8 [Acipenser ruthenus]
MGVEQLCVFCAQLLKDFVALVRGVTSDFAQKIRDCVDAISQCSCLKRKKAAASKLYKPVLQQHERQAAQKFLQHLDTGTDKPLLDNDCLHALRTLAVSENPNLQQSAAMYYLHISQQLNAPLPVEFLEPYNALLQSSDMEVQRITSLSLVNLLVEENVNKELVVEMGMLEPILELLESGDPTVQCNSCACVATLTTSESNREAIASAGGVLPVLVLAKSYDPRVQQNAVGAVLNLTRSVNTQEALVAMGCIPQLKALLRSSSEPVSESAVTLLSALSEHPPNRGALVDEGFLKILKELLSYRTNPVILSHTTYTIRNLSSSQSVQAVIDSECVEGLLQTLACTDTTEEPCFGSLPV